MTSVRAIETRYAGCRFRSRLEARWAVFFDALCIGWEYEPQGYILPSGRWYLPDFRLTECGTWVEVKGNLSSITDDELLDAAAGLPHISGAGEDAKGVMLVSNIPDVTDLTLDPLWPIYTAYNDGSWSGDVYGFSKFDRNMRPWVGDISGLPSVEFIPYVDSNEELSDPCRSAYVAARTARFEHGECG